MKYLNEILEKVNKYGWTVYFTDGEIALDKCYAICTDNNFTIFRNIECFYQLAINEVGDIYYLYIDIESWQEENKQEFNLGLVDYEKIDYIQKVEGDIELDLAEFIEYFEFEE